MASVTTKTPPSRQAAGDVAELGDGVPAEDERSGGMKRPGRSHEVPHSRGGMGRCRRQYKVFAFFVSSAPSVS